MKRSILSKALFVSLLALAGLHPAQADPPAPCAGARWIGLKPAQEATCPDNQGWKGRSLFATVLASMPRGLRKQAERLGLDDFCVYEPPGADPLTGNPARSAELSTTLAHSAQPPAALVQKLRQLKQDCPVLAGAGGTGVPGDWPQLQAHFFDQAGRVALPPSASPQVWLTFVDTQPTQESPPTRESPPGHPVRSMHGFTLAHLADRLLCEPRSLTPCPVRIRTRLAMPMTGPSSVESSSEDAIIHAEAHGGGLYGRLGDLSLAVVEELLLWHRERQPGGRLVLNLSLGWEADSFDIGGDEARVREMSGPAQAVYWSLQLARHCGALVMAASGNRRAGSNGACQPPLLPAAWEVKPPAIGSPLSDWFRKCFTRWQRVPVRAGGAVQSEGVPLPNARPCSLPPRVAYGDHVVVATRTGDPTAVLTGTSAGAAVISASAAAVWSLRPELSANQVTDLLYRSGDRLGFVANLYQGGGPESTRPAPQVRRISVCRALDQAIEERPAGRGTAPELGCRSWSPQPFPVLARTPSPGAATAVLVGSDDDLGYCSSCSGLKPLPTGLEPLARPQPEEDPCTTCNLTGGGPPPSPLFLASLGSPETTRLLITIGLKPGWRPAGWGEPCPVLEKLELEVERFDAGDATLVIDRRTFQVPDIPPNICDPVFHRRIAVELDWPSLDRTTARLRFHLLRPGPEGTEERIQVESPVLVQQVGPEVTDLTTSLN
ncbi:MAG TPA: S8 family serine peptidase [Thermoanaerobaculia bacterium]|nr:S8 family serine peptidase [Thermoanaerobaculia bacterium]